MSRYPIRALQSLDEMMVAAELQRVYWGHDSESVVPAHMLFTIASYGGHVLAAWDGDRMIAVLIGLIGTNVEESGEDRLAIANLLMASKRMVVLPEYRSSGIGFELKLAQRQLAIKQGIRLVTWTFDPLLSLNAHLNLRKLGCVAQKYYLNLYGESDRSGLATFGWSDRLKVDWWVTNRRVDERLNGSRVDLTLDQYLGGNATIINPARADGQFIHPADALIDCSGVFGLVEIPLNYPLMVEQSPAVARAWQMHIREAFRVMFGAGYIVTDFLRGNHEGRDRAFYLLSYNMGFDFSLN